MNVSDVPAVTLNIALNRVRFVSSRKRFFRADLSLMVSVLSLLIFANSVANLAN